MIMGRWFKGSFYWLCSLFAILTVSYYVSGCIFALRYLGREGWVPAMYLKKLGSDRRRSRTGRRKSRLFSSHELRDEIEEDEVIQGKKV